MTLGTLPVKTCSQCGRTEPWGPTWRHGSDPLGPYMSPILTMQFCSEVCEVKMKERKTA